MTCVTQNEQLDEGYLHLEYQYFDSQCLYRPNADNIDDVILQSSQKLKLEDFPQLPMEGPSVNWKVLDKFNTKLDDQVHQEPLS